MNQRPPARRCTRTHDPAVAGAIVPLIARRPAARAVPAGAEGAVPPLPGSAWPVPVGVAGGLTYFVPVVIDE